MIWAIALMSEDALWGAKEDVTRLTSREESWKVTEDVTERMEGWDWSCQLKMAQIKFSSPQEASPPGPAKGDFFSPWSSDTSTLNYLFSTL